LLLLGYGIFATTDFSPGDFLLEYVGDIIDPSAADEIVDQTYVYYFSWASKKYRSIFDMHCILRVLITFTKQVILFVCWPDCKPEGPLFSEIVCLSVSDWHFYSSTLTDFDETWSQGPYSDLVWLSP